MDIETNKETTSGQNDELEVVEVELTGEKPKHRHRHKSSDGHKQEKSEHSHHSHHSHQHKSSESKSSKSKSSESKSSKRKHRSNKSGKLKLWQKLLIAAGSVLLSLVLILTGTFLYLRYTGKSQFEKTSYSISAPENIPAQLYDDGNTIKYNGKTYKYKSDNVNILFMGIDDHGTEEEKAEIGGNNQADVIILINVDFKENKMTLVNIPRDIITEVNAYSPTGGYSGTEKLPIALSYSYGDSKHTSCINTLNSVRRMFYNIPINSYLSLQVNGIATINDSIGGVDVKCPEDLAETSPNGITMVKGESYHLEGDDATFFVMTRRKDTPDANLLRNERQRIYLSSFIQKTINLSKSDLSTPLRLYNEAEPYTCTNISANKVTYLASELLGKGAIGTETISVPVTVTQVENHAENYIKEKEFYELFLDVFYEEVQE